MAVTARFVADFSNFLSEATRADGALDRLTASAGITSASVDKVGKSFSGEALIASALRATEAVAAIGGASKLTENEMARVNRTVTEAIQKMDLLGIKAPADMLNLADATKKVPPALNAATSATHLLQGAMSGLMTMLGPAAILGSLIAAAKSALTLGDQLVKAADRTGISIEALQQLSFIADQSGNSLDELTSAISQMQNRLASGDTSAVAAVEELGVSLNTLRELKPDQQFLVLAKAIAGVENEADRTRLAMDVFGRTGSAILPTLIADTQRLAKASSVMSAATVKSLDDLGDLISGLFTVTKNVIGTSVAAVFDGLRLMGNSFSRFFEAVLAAAQGEFSRAVKIMADVADTTLPEIGKASSTAATALKDSLLPTLSTNSSELEKLQNRSEQYSKENRKIAETLPQVSDQVERLTKSFSDQIVAHEKAQQSLGKVAPTYEGFRIKLTPLITDIPLLSSSIAAAGSKFAAGEKQALAFAMATGAIYPAVIKSTAELDRLAAAAATTGGKFQNFSASLKNLGPTIIAAIQGGGDAIKSIGASLGQSLGADLGASIAGKFTGKFGQMLGSTMGPLGALAGQLLGAGMSKAMGWIKGLFSGPMKKELTEVEVEFNDLKKKILENVGDVSDLERQYQALGLSIVDAFGMKGKAGIEAMKKAQDEFNKRLEATKTQLQDLRDKFAGLQTELDGVISKAYEMGYQFDKEGKLIGFNFRKVADVAKEFGIDLAALGPAFQQAQVNEQALKVIDAFNLLTMSGTEVGVVLNGMKDEINNIVRDSLQFGTTIPKNMEPMIAQLIKQGDLTDKNGQKITDMAGLKFGDPVASEYDKINKQIDIILAAMSDLIGRINELVSVIDAATRPRTLTVTAEYYDPGPPAGFGETDQSRGRETSGEGFASGTMGKMGSWFANFGSGTKAVLHGREAVIRSDQAAAFAADMGGGDSSAVASEIAAMRGEMMSVLPRAIARSVRDALLVAG